MKTESEYEKLEPEFKAKWIEALRSGMYTQIKEDLIHENGHSGHIGQTGYCCLGVACKLSDVQDDFMVNHGTIPNTMPTFDLIPRQLRGDAIENELVYELTYMNDNGGSFEQIADWIEANL